jgi:hypothetical protein
MFTNIFRHPVVMVAFILSLIFMVISVVVGVLFAENTAYALAALLIGQISSSIFFPIVVGYYYDLFKENESGGLLWRVFKDFSEGGILTIYKDRERNHNAENAEVDLRSSFEKHEMVI